MNTTAVPTTPPRPASPPPTLFDFFVGLGIGLVLFAGLVWLLGKADRSARNKFD